MLESSKKIVKAKENDYNRLKVKMSHFDHS